MQTEEQKKQAEAAAKSLGYSSALDLSQKVSTGGLTLEQQQNINKGSTVTGNDPNYANYVRDNAAGTSGAQTGYYNPNTNTMQPGTPSPYYPRSYTEETPTPVQTPEQIQEQKMKNAQSLIDSINKQYDSEVAEQRIVNEGRTRGTNAISALTGLSGSTDAQNAATQTDKLNAKDVEAINNERSVAVQGVLTKIRGEAIEEARQSRIDNIADSERILANRKARKEEAVKDLTALAMAGLTPPGLQANDPQSYAYLVQQMGGETQLKALFTLNRPKEAIIDKKVQDGKYIIAYQNPLTNSVRIETVDLGFDVPVEWDTVDLGGQIMFYDPADPTNQKFISKSMTPDQAADNARASNPSANFTPTGEFGTPEYTLSAIQQSKQYGDKRLLTDERKNITASKRALGMLETYNQVLDGTLDKDTSKEIFGEGTGPIKGRIRTLASQWGGDASAAAINATIQGIIPTIARGIFQEVGVLTDQDIANYRKTVPDISKPENANKLIELVLLRTLERSYADTLLTAAQNQTNVSNFAPEYQDVLNRINSLTGGTTSRVLVDQSGQSFDASDLTPEEYEQALADGYVEQ